jgi:hypothetical protein
MSVMDLPASLSSLPPELVAKICGDFGLQSPWPLSACVAECHSSPGPGS